jgi:hypothetical protein
MSKQILSEEFKRMQFLAGLITESRLNEAESALRTYLTSIADKLSKKPDILAKEITDYLNSVLVRKGLKDATEAPGSMFTGKGTFYIVPSNKPPFVFKMAQFTKENSGKGMVFSDVISSKLATFDKALVNEFQNKIMEAYIQDTKFTTEKFGGFEKLGTSHPNDFKSN